MTRSSRQTVSQTCPNCGKVHDTSVYVSGQQLQCSCGIRFEVVRTDVKGASTSAPTSSGRNLKAVREKSDGARTGAAEEPEVPKTEELPKPPAPSTGPLDKTVASHVDEGRETTVAVPPPPVPGYELLELLGRGGMGEVWRARQLSLNRPVALKLLPEKFSKDREFVARFDKEATALAALSHPNIVQIIDRGQAGEHYYIVMELVTGTNLREMLNGARLSVRDALRIGVQVARAIDYAHEQKIVHRDLKPENILVDARGHVKIADFGLAGMHGSERNISLTATSVAMGTANYMAPEQRRDAKHVDHRADLYSMGVLFYEMLTAELPIGRFRLPSEKNPELDPKIDEVLARLLDSDPLHRPARALEVVTELEPLIPSGGQSSGARPASRPPGGTLPPGSFVQQPGAGWKAGVFVLGAMVIAGAVLKWWPEESSGPHVAPAWYADTEDEVFSASEQVGTQLSLSFQDAAPDAGEELNVHAGVWKIEGGVLSAVQYGDPTDFEEHVSIVPRAYVAHRYYAAEDFDVEVDMELNDLGPEFPAVDPTWQRFAELAFRIKDLQVSVWAIPERQTRDGTQLRKAPSEMRLLWRYFTPTPEEVQGNSAQDQGMGTEDEIRVPKGKFRVRLKMTGLKTGEVDVEAFVGKQRIAHKVLKGLSGQVGKVALGCRNLSCRFDDLVVRGRPMPQPSRARR